MMMGTDIAPGRIVRLTEQVRFASRTFEAGDVALVESVHEYPSGIVDGNVIVSVCVVDGLYTDNTPAFSIPVPLLLRQVSS